MKPARGGSPLPRVVATVSLLALVALLGDHAAAQTLLQRPLPGTDVSVPGQPELQPPRRAPITLTPSIGAGVEYNDNVLLDNSAREWDVIGIFTPGLTFTAERPTWRFNAGYYFENRVYWREPERNNAFDRQVFTLDSFYRLAPNLTLSLDDEFSYERGLNAFRSRGIATGRDPSWTNTIRPGVTWQIDPLTTTRAFLGWTTWRFEGEDLSDSDSYHLDLAAERAFTPRLSGIAGYQAAYFDLDRGENATTHTPRIGARYDFTPTLTGTLTAGPTFVIQDSETRVTPSVSADLRKRYAWGTTTFTYMRDVGIASGLGGATDNQTIGLSVLVSRVWRGLTLDVTPQYTTAESDDDTIDVRALTLPIQATYQFTPWFSATLGYAFFFQRDESRLRSATTGEPLARDVDQNRVYFTLVFGYPITFD
ncbi:MAG: hypothetical protein HYR51_07710 [Candidatus Rokubacteria bacterium]|nr:hypothetical protein [Candidatus Rokubacteria bacterium]